MQKITKDILKQIYTKRPENAHKYDYGLLVVIGGSEFYSGAPALAALAAQRAGVDMVRVIAPKRAADIIASFSPILAAYPLEDGKVHEGNVSTLLFLAEGAAHTAPGKSCAVIGEGMGRSEETQKAIRLFLEQTSLPVVIDSDAIHATAKQHPELVAQKPFLFTPHAHEFLVLTGRDVREASLEERVKAVREAAQEFQTTILFKGPQDIISDGATTLVNETGNAYMTSGGTGDVLAGIAGALIARGESILTAAAGAAYICGAAGELASERMRDGLVATDVIEKIPDVIYNSSI
ncbi:MAG: NAD(P)H-hydrate dehydratase [Candidatus Yanofskybacteria bacterium]|nr:NAD(P)H-hydrate dehydratase [Candidatus Yanofskybacteria bacterium]